MTTTEIIQELCAISNRLASLRKRNRHAKWFGSMMRAIESLVDGAANAVRVMEQI